MRLWYVCVRVCVCVFVCAHARALNRVCLVKKRETNSGKYFVPKVKILTVYYMKAREDLS